MNYEKKYKEALGWMRSLYDGLHGATKEEAEHYFPELKESKDEKIKREIVAYINELADLKNEKIPTKWLAWLEKQGEQKSADKVEPKFKVGDWITDGYIYYKITEILDDRYIIESKYDKRGAILFEHENRYHLWTIEDAKDGDVLVTDYGENDSIIMYKSRCTIDTINVHCCLDNKFTCSNIGVFNAEDVKPATKHERDLLFQTMKEMGYEWDAEKKELKKIKPKFKVGDKVTIKGDNTVYTIGIIAPDKTCWLTHESRAYGWATFGVLKHYVE